MHLHTPVLTILMGLTLSSQAQDLHRTYHWWRTTRNHAHEGQIRYAIAFHPYDRINTISISYNLWETQLQQAKTLQKEEYLELFITYHHNGGVVITGNYHLNWQGTTTMVSLQNIEFKEFNINLKPFKKALMTGYHDWEWHVTSPTEQRYLQGHEFLGLSLTPYEALGEYHINLAGVIKTAESQRSLKGHEALGGVINFNPYGDSFASGYHQLAFTADFSTPHQQRTLQGSYALDATMAVNPRGSAVIFGNFEIGLAGHPQQPPKFLAGEESLLPACLVGGPRHLPELTPQ